MSYDYTNERNFVFTEAGMKMFIACRDNVRELLAKSGAVREQEIHRGLSGDSWRMLACVDYLVERGEIKRVYDLGPRQHNVYVSNHE